jgi:hypothetical protein
MREGAVTDLTNVWYEVLTRYEGKYFARKSWKIFTLFIVVNAPQLVIMALQNIKRYVGWIDIGLVVNEKYMAALFKLLSKASFREEVCDCLHEVSFPSSNCK